MFNLQKSYFNDLKERVLLAGQTLTEEGSCLIFVADGAGGVAVRECAGAANERFAGFSITDAMKVTTEVVQESFTVPATAPYTVTLKNTNIVAGSERVYNSTDSVLLTEACPTPAAGQYCLVDSTGVLTFNSAEASDTIVVTYRYTLTMQQVIDKYHQRSVNNTAQDYFSSVSVGCGEGEIFTSQFDTSLAYAIDDLIYTGASGRVTSANTSGVVVGICTQVPSTSDALLGVKYLAR